MDIGINEKKRKEVSKVLNLILSDVFVLHVKARNFHWNVTGPHFRDLHKFFEEIYESLTENIDDIAERVRALGERPFSSMGEYVKNTRIKESLGQVKYSEMVFELLLDYEFLIREFRVGIEVAEKAEDFGSADFLTGLMEDYEKKAWMLRATLEK